MGIDGQRQFGSGNSGLVGKELEVGHHTQSVHTRVRSAGTVESRLAGEQFRQGLLDDILHADASFLDLPAFVARPVIGNDQLELGGRHQANVPKLSSQANLKQPLIWVGAQVRLPAMKLSLAIIVYFLIGLVVGLGILLAMKGSYWLL